MGRGGTKSLWSSGITCNTACQDVEAVLNKQCNLEEVKIDTAAVDAAVSVLIVVKVTRCTCWPTPAKVIGTSLTGN